MLTFEDIQKMNFALLRQTGDKDDFKPSDLVDIESGDSDNEILARFKSQKSPVQKTGIYNSEFLSRDSIVDDQTPEFSLYRLDKNKSTYF